MSQVKDANGKPVHRNIQRNPNNGNWDVTVWEGGINGLATNIRRYVYLTRKEARNADISDPIGRNGRVG